MNKKETTCPSHAHTHFLFALARHYIRSNRTANDTQGHAPTTIALSSLILSLVSHKVSARTSFLPCSTHDSLVPLLHTVIMRATSEIIDKTDLHRDMWLCFFSLRNCTYCKMNISISFLCKVVRACTGAFRPWVSFFRNERNLADNMFS